MKIGFTGIFPYLLSYTQSMDNKYNGLTRAFYVRIRENKKDDPSILQHELCHVRQWWTVSFIMLTLCALLDYRFNFIGVFINNINEPYLHSSIALCFVTHQILYFFVDEFRFNMESRAYAVSAKMDLLNSVDRIEVYANNLSKYYRLNKTPQQCEQSIRSYL